MAIDAVLQRLCLVRHGITAVQEENRYCGHSDPALSPRGIAQIRELARELKPLLPPSAPVFSSDLTRATQSAGLLTTTPATRLPWLREINFGEWEGLRFEETGCGDPDRLRELDFQFPGGESARMLCARVAAGAAGLFATAAPVALVVAHAGSLSALMSLLLNEPWERWHVRILPHGGMSWLEREQGRRPPSERSGVADGWNETRRDFWRLA